MKQIELFTRLIAHKITAQRTELDQLKADKNSPHVFKGFIMKLSNRLSSLAISSLLSVVVFCIGMSSVNAREFNNEDNKIVAVIVNLFEDAHNDDFNQESYTNKENITLQFTTNDDQKISAKLVICDMP